MEQVHGRTVFESHYLWRVLHFRIIEDFFLHVRVDINVYLLKCTISFELNLYLMFMFNGLILIS